jgi:hypothetical protein
MARAVFQKGERVFVKPVGTWAQIEHLLPQWVKGVEEPLKILYDVGLGREFQAHELQGEPKAQKPSTSLDNEHWRIMRARNHWTLATAGGRGMHPGTYPVVLTDALDWGGWRVPAAEYERDPERIEHQARVIANALRLLRLTAEVSRAVNDLGNEASPDLKALAKQADDILGAVYDDGTKAHRAPKQDDQVSPALR